MMTDEAEPTPGAREGPRPPRSRARALALVAGIMTLALGSPMTTRLNAQISPGTLARAHRSLEGASGCTKCHGLKREPMSQLCLNCHKEVRWLMDQGRGVHGREVRQSKKECASCHPDHAGADFDLVAWPEGGKERFDHRKAGWTLEGAHADTKCEKCHAMANRVSPAVALAPPRATPGWMGLESACASCHERDDAHNGKLNHRCETCHDEKKWDKAPAFDHERSDYPLTGRHTDVACDKCHLVPKLAPKVNAKGKPIPVFKPLPFRECSNCHPDPHKGRMTGKCSECHVTRGFEVIDRREFNHASTRYPLRGRHVTVGCNACHGPDLAKKDPPFATCASCHSDPHRGEATMAGMAQDCAACHRVEGFAPSTYTVAQHRSAPYPLEGKHLAVKCTACHTPSAAPGALPYTGARLRMKFAQCADCHADAHGGQLARRADGGACEACHAVSGFAPSTFTIANHATLRLPLDGRHAAIACTACHTSIRTGLPPATTNRTTGSAGISLTLADVRCASCHVDPHRGRLAGPGSDGGCRDCHGTDTFHPSTVDASKHDKYRFRLEGAHRAVPCGQCHREMKGTHGKSSLLLAAGESPSLPFAERRETCAACHETPHGSQFSVRRDGGACDACHGVEAFAPASRFDHERDTAFRLRGAHAKVACAQCHKATVTGAGASIVAWRGLSSKCESCHAARSGGATS